MVDSAEVATYSRTAAVPVGQPLRVLHALAPGVVGGLERVVCTLVPAQCAAGIDARVAAVVDHEPADHPVVAQLRDSGVEVDVVRVSARSYAAERRQIAALCTRWRPHIVHTHGYRADLIDSPVARRLGTPCVSTLHGFTGGGVRNRVYEWLTRRAARTMDAVVAVSRPLAAQLAHSGVPPERLHVVPNAHAALGEFLERPAARRVLGLPANAFVVGWVGRLTREKGGDTLIDAMSLPQAEGIVASVVGEGREREALAVRAAALTSMGRLHWHGLVPDAWRLLRAFDAFVLSSRSEGTPMVLFEAMDAGIPIVATRVGGVPDVLTGEDALLVDANDPSAIASAIREISNNPEAARNRALSARNRLVANYSVEQWVARYNAIYRHVTATVQQ